MTSSIPSKNPMQRTISQLPLNNWFFRILLILVVVAALWFGYKKFSPSASSATQYQTAQVEKGTLIVSLSSTGTVANTNSATVNTTATGVVKKLYAKNGAQVKAGAPLVELELDQTSKQKYAQASASYQSAKNSLASAQNAMNTLQSKMFASNQKFINGAVVQGLATSDPNYIQQSADWLATEADYKNQQQVIAQARTSVSSAWLSLQESSPIIYAPISGELNGLSLQVGSVIASSTSSTATSQKIANVLTKAVPTVTVSLTEIDVPKVEVGNKATLTFDAFSGKTFTGKVISVDPIGTVSSGVTTFSAVIALDSADPNLYANMSAQVNIITEVKTDILLVPSSAVQTTNGTKQVRVMKNGQPQSVTVETGSASTSQTEITTGLSEGEEIVTSSTSPSTAKTSTSQTTSPFSALGGGNRTFGAGAAGATVRIAR